MTASTLHMRFSMRSSGAFKTADSAAATLTSIRCLFKDSPVVLAAIDFDIFGRSKTQLTRLATACHLQRKRAAATARKNSQSPEDSPEDTYLLQEQEIQPNAEDDLLNQPWGSQDPQPQEHMTEENPDYADVMDVMQMDVSFLLDDGSQ